ncbi:hypothetical protein [Bradyrhizobium genomosp. III]|uniref:hypothetical protein n=1 Tax=Bradyrhizobium genomosp. III TaxID=2683271 RepID=UPI0009DA9CCD|nr:hypothetical protein [Bradyrhizobium sp. CCBAU 15635]
MPRPNLGHTPTHTGGRPLKITFGEMRGMGLRGILVYCHCGHHVALNADRWLDDVRLSDLEPRFVCQGCGGRGAEVRPDFERGNPRLAIQQ